MLTSIPPPTPRPSHRAFWARRLQALALLSVLGLLLPLPSHLLAASSGALAWLLDLASHWQWLFLLGLLFAGGLAAWLDKRWAVVLLAAPLPWLTAASPAPGSEPQGPLFSVASTNVSLHNQDPQALARWLAQERPDVVIVLEVSPDYAVALQSLRDYPFQQLVPQDDPFGIALLSRHPLRQVQVIKDADAIAHIEAQVQWQNQLVGVIAVHPMPPLSAHYHGVRNAKLRALASQASASKLPTVLAGDLNATPWSSAFSGLAQHGLRRASGLAPTWPAALHGLLGIPIDHVLVTAHWAVVSRQVGPDLGSDHLPVLLRLALQEAD
jgi:endonuclease/exonuclease/phosphatase (EEP) superfamily protein YafD